jgi:nucleotide-binding universal stress UspA family protein
MEKKPSCLLVPVDFEVPSLTALDQTYNLARLLKIEICLLYVHEETGIFSRFFPDEQSNEILKQIAEKLETLATMAEEKAGVKVRAFVEKGKPHDLILQKAKDLNALMIFMGTTNSDEEIVGVTTHKVVRSSKCPVITVRADNYHDGCRTILLPLDLTTESRQKIGWSIEIAKLYRARIQIISVLWSKDEEIRRNLHIQLKQAKNFIEKVNIPCTAELIDTTESRKTLVPAILDYTESHPEIDLIVIMTQQELSIVDFFLDSDAQQVIRSAIVPVMTVVPREIGQTSIRTF